MSYKYRLVQWNRHKLIYDSLLLCGIAIFLVAFVVGGLLLSPDSAGETELVIRGLGVCAMVLLHIVLLIGPLARLDNRFAPLLYNRRHLGVTMFLLALVHGILSTAYWGGFGSQNPLKAIFVESGQWWPPSLWPFEFFGLLALVILFVLAATSHDYWLKNLTPRVWKSLHMGVYLAYTLLIGHVAFGALQRPDGYIAPVLLGLGFTIVNATHLASGLVQRERDRRSIVEQSCLNHDADGMWADAGLLNEIPETRAKRLVFPDGTEVAVYRISQQAYAVSNACPHQGGPLSEGQVINGCITCPWHGYQFRPHNGCSPPPYTETIPTYPVRIEQGRVWVSMQPNPSATTPTLEREVIDA